MKKVDSIEKSGYVPAEEYARLLEELARIREYADGLDNRLMAEQALRGRLVEEGVASRMSEVKDTAKAELKADVLNEFSERESSLAAREQAANLNPSLKSVKASLMFARENSMHLMLTLTAKGSISGRNGMR